MPQRRLLKYSLYSLYSLFSLLAVLAISQITASGAADRSPSGATVLDNYSFRRADKRTRLPKYLREVSGLAAISRQRVQLHDDNNGKVWRFQPQTRTLETGLAQSEPVKGDFEGIANFGEDALLSTSHATLLRFTPAGDDAEDDAGDDAEPNLRWIDLPFKGLCNFEGLASIAQRTDAGSETTPKSAVLLLPCKYPRFVEAGLPAANDRVLYVFRHLYTADSKAYVEQEMTTLEIDVGPILRDFRLRRLRPSAIEVVDNHLIILAGKERVLLETDLNGELLDWRRLPWPRHRQAEGLTVLEDGSLIIADEGRWLGGTITLYRRKT